MIGPRLRALRRAYGLTQSELAEAAGVSERSVSRWERASRIRRTAVRKLAVAWGVGLDELEVQG